ncbi:MAG: hypothetical protein ACTSXP_09195 [Promethearchaeota archaeon]
MKKSILVGNKRVEIMIVIFWISFLVIVAMISYLLIEIIKIKTRPRWGRIFTDNLKMEQRNIELDGKSLKSYFYTSTDFDYKDSRPGVIVLPRRDKKYPYFEHWGAHFALQGYPTLCVELFDKKSSLKEYVEKIVSAFPKIKKSLCSDPKVNSSKLACVGIEDSAEPAIYSTIVDDDFKIVFGISTGLLDTKKIKNDTKKIYLVHCKDDNVNPEHIFRENCQDLGIDADNYFLLDLGGRHMNSQEAVIAAYMSIKLKQTIQPVFEQIERKK